MAAALKVSCLVTLHHSLEATMCLSTDTLKVNWTQSQSVWTAGCFLQVNALIWQNHSHVLAAATRKILPDVELTRTWKLDSTSIRLIAA